MSNKNDSYLPLTEELSLQYTKDPLHFCLFSILETNRVNNCETIHSHLGHSLDQFEIRLRIDAVYHIVNRHSLRGAADKIIKASDFSLIDRLIIENDKLSPGKDDKKNGMKRLIFQKKIEAVTYKLITQIHLKRKYLSVITFYKV
ncbi:MAG: hypothetical protein QM523_08155 [Candidatus Pacebacteria bacterium]|nr:hypothetical protein [Candidatus Paceibacterota bacterium]